MDHLCWSIYHELFTHQGQVVFKVNTDGFSDMTAIYYTDKKMSFGLFTFESNWADVIYFIHEKNEVHLMHRYFQSGESRNL